MAFNFVKIGIDMSNGKKSVKLPKNWTTLTKSIYNNEPDFAVLTGKINDIIIIDLDNKDPEFSALIWFQKHFGDINLVNTLVTKTINHGFHIYFKYHNSIKSRLNFLNLPIDILSDSRCAYEGQHYPIFLDKPIRELTEHELCILSEKRINKKSKSPKKSPKKSSKKSTIPNYKQVNNLLQLPNDTKWNMEKLDNSTKFIPECYICLVDPTKQHSHNEHSAIFINDDKSIVKSCFSHGTQIVSDNISKQIYNFLVLNKSDDINNKDTMQIALKILETKTLIFKDKKFYLYNNISGIYEPKDDLQIIKEIKHTVDYLVSEGQYFGWFEWINKINYKENLIKELRAECFIEHDIDSNPFLLGFPNGVLDLQTNEFRKGRPDEYITMKCGVDYDINIDTSLAYDVLEGMFQDVNERDFILNKLALCLEGFNREQALTFNYGFTASNGKSFLMERFRAIMGDYGGSFPVTLLTNKMKGAGETNSSLVEFSNKRFLYCSEPENGSKLNSNMIKQLTGDIIKTRGLYNDKDKEIQPTFKLFVCCNNLPNFDSYDEGISRRIFITEYKTKFCINPLKKNERLLKRYSPEDIVIINKGFMGIIILQYFKLYNNKFIYMEPTNFYNIRKLFLNDNKDIIKNLLLETYEIGEDKDFVKLKDVKDILKSNGIKEKDIISIIKIVLDTFEDSDFKENSCVNNKSIRNFFIKLKKS